MRRISVLTAVAVLGTGLVTGCGGGGSGSESAYCKDLKSSAAGIRSFTAGSTPDFSQLSDFIAKAHDLADEAPGDIKDDWKVMTDAMDALTSALQDAGIKLEDLGSLMTGQVPDGVDPSKLAALPAKLQEIGSDKVQKAGDAISKQAKDTCKVDLKKTA
jgi:hypothetical protein